MHLSRVFAENFRIFGQASKALDLRLRPGLNLLVGENDSGKSAVIDAIRLVLGTRDNEWFRLSEEDFHIQEDGERAHKLVIDCRFEDLSDEEIGLFLEWVGLEESANIEAGKAWQPYLRLWLEAERSDSALTPLGRSVSVSLKAGTDVVGKLIDGEARDLLRTTYLKPLRDAQQELGARKGSRLSQVLLAYPEIKGQEKKHEKGTLTYIAREANRNFRENAAVVASIAKLNSDYFTRFLLGDDSLAVNINIADPSLRSILEHLQLLLMDSRTTDSEDPLQQSDGLTTPHGLGLQNLLFIATELLLLQSPLAPVPLLLLEEPEAHLHPQYQMRLMDFLSSRSQVQVIMTSHSPNLASSIDLEKVTVIQRGQCFPLAHEYTSLAASDYEFLRRFLDVTKANLFFARGVLLVEGISEQMLLPVIAELMGRPLARYGVSIVNVGHTGLFRYARIFQRTDKRQMNVKVAAITDLDIPPDYASKYLHSGRRTRSSYSGNELEQKKKDKDAKASGGPVRTFVSPYWTLEHDLAVSFPVHIFVAIQLALAVDSSLSEENVVQQALADYKKLRRQMRETGIKDRLAVAADIYEPIYLKRCGKPEVVYQFSRLLQRYLRNRSLKFGHRVRKRLPAYLVESIDYVTSI